MAVMRRRGPGAFFSCLCRRRAQSKEYHIFFVAFGPQFLDPHQPMPAQMEVGLATFLTLAIINTTSYGLMATAARRTIRRSSVLRWINRIGGSLLIGAGIFSMTFTIAWRPPATYLSCPISLRCKCAFCFPGSFPQPETLWFVSSFFAPP